MNSISLAIVILSVLAVAAISQPLLPLIQHLIGRWLLRAGYIRQVPIKHEARLAGMLLMASHVPPQSCPEVVAPAVTGTIENTTVYESMRRERSELQKATEGIIHAVSLLIEIRDQYTAGHQRRVAELASAIATEMGLSGWDARGIHVAGLLHDVGKIAVPIEILIKPGKISQYEFSIIKSHPRVGYEILEKIEFPWPVTLAILQHHERLNGSGYPEGLSGDEIILEARILGVADVVEAMSSHRPYRPALGLDCALQEISQHRNVLYDSYVVDSCLGLLKKDELEFEKLMSTAADSERMMAQTVR